ncbi:hypothetical protein Tco_0636600, partial [Tanacetum coccineum]
SGDNDGCAMVMVVAVDGDDGGGDMVMKEEMVKWRGNGVVGVGGWK